LPVARNYQIATMYVLAVVPHMHAVFVIYVAVPAHPAVVPVHVAVTVLMAKFLEFMDLQAPWTGNIKCLY